jgi:hypothetical protein
MGSATPPLTGICLAAFVAPNKVGLTAGARAWSKHFHRYPERGDPARTDADTLVERDSKKKFERAEADTSGWWGQPSGPVAIINAKALVLFWNVDGASWRNLHWLPHRVLVYEIRVLAGYGMVPRSKRGIQDDI